MGYIVFLIALIVLLIAFIALVMAKGEDAEKHQSASNVTSGGRDSEVHAEMPEDYPEKILNDKPFEEKRL